MKYLILLLICFNLHAEDSYSDVGIDQAKVNGGDLNTYYNATVETLNHNSWKFTSNTNPDCIDNTHKWNCKRGDVQLVEWYQYEATMQYSWDFIVHKYPSWPSPYWIMPLQDWRKSNIKDSMGRHPMSTLKLKNYNGGLYLAHFDNSWQWNYEFPENDPTDTIHSIPDGNRGCWGVAPIPTDGIHHQENTCNGAYKIRKNVPYHIEFIISPTGASLVIDGYVVTDIEYKTKSNFEWSYIKWGMYWDKNYNVKNEISQQTEYTISNFKRSIKIKD